MLADSHGRPKCADGQPQIATDVLCVPADTHRRPVCVLMDTHGHTRKATDVLCVLTDTHGHTGTATDVLCVLTDTHGQQQTHKNTHGQPQM